MTVRVWVNGQVVDAEQARVAALDHGLTVGDGVFETCKVVDGQPFALTRHLRRLLRSCSVLALTPPPESVIREAVSATLAPSGVGSVLPLGRLRITVTGGAGPLGSGRGGAAPTLVVAVAPATPWPDDIAVVSVPWTRNEHSAIAGAKTTSYAENVVALNYAHEQGAHEALLANTAGNLCEGTGSNVILDLGGELLTPTLASGCLAGVTRELFLQWAADEGLPVSERDLPMAALNDAHDVLLTSSTRNVQQVRMVNGRSVAGTELGRAAVELFARRELNHIDP